MCPSRPSFSKRGGFTLLELLIAMTFAVLLATGIVLSITTALRVWKLTTEQNDLQQEARTIMDLVTHDVRNCYMGISRTGFFIGGVPSDQVDTTPPTPTDPLFLTTQSTSGEQTSFLPEEVQQQWDQTVERPISDLMAVNWQWFDATTGAAEDQPPGLYRTTQIVQINNPDNQPTDEYGASLGVVSTALISDRVKSLHLRYYDGQQWLDSWDSRQQQFRAPQQVSVELELLDPGEHANENGAGVSNPTSSGERKHVYRTVVTLPTY